MAALTTILVVLAPLSSVGVSAEVDTTYLGKPTNSVPLPPNRPLANFQHLGPFLRQGRRPELLFLGTMVEGNSAMERWPLVKALRQFGTFSGAAAAETRSCGTSGPPLNTLECSPVVGKYGDPTGFATYNLERARYRSRYLTFVATDLIDPDLNVLTVLSPVENQLFTRYVRNVADLSSVHASTSMFQNIVWNTSFQVVGRRTFPLVSIGGYLETAYGAATEGDIESNQGALLPFDTVQKTLVTGRPTGSVPAAQDGLPPGKIPSSLVPDVNAEANVITALICHADGKRPRGVCNRAVIRSILHHVR